MCVCVYVCVCAALVCYYSMPLKVLLYCPFTHYVERHAIHAVCAYLYVEIVVLEYICLNCHPPYVHISEA